VSSPRAKSARGLGAPLACARRLRLPDGILSLAESGLLPSGILGLANPDSLLGSFLGFPEAVRGFSPVSFPPPGLRGRRLLDLVPAGLGMAGGARRYIAEAEEKPEDKKKRVSENLPREMGE
jgi:hypothetical protein